MKHLQIGILCIGAGLLASCLTVKGPVALKGELKEPVKELMLINPLITAGNKSTIRNLTKREQVDSIENAVLKTYPKDKMLESLKQSGKTINPANSTYSYKDFFESDGNIKSRSVKALLGPGKIMVIPVARIIEKKENVDLDSRYMCPDQYFSILEVSLKYVDSDGNLILDSAEIERENAKVEYNLHGMHTANEGLEKGLIKGKTKCGMLFKSNQNYKSAFEMLNTDYIKEVM